MRHHSCSLRSFLLCAASFLLFCDYYHADAFNWFRRPNLRPPEMTEYDLQRQFPEVDPVTVGRFHATLGNESPQALREYLSWQLHHPVIHMEDDDMLWEHVANYSIPYYQRTTGVTIPTPPPLPVIYNTNATDKEGHILLQILSKRMDLENYPVALYVDMFAAYLEAMFQQLDDTEQCAIMIDLRPGRGWPNPHYLRLLETVELLTSSLDRIHPGRVAVTILFPVPPYGRVVWNVYRPLVGKSANEIRLVPGASSKLHEPVPFSYLSSRYMDGAVVNATESHRKGLWIG